MVDFNDRRPVPQSLDDIKAANAKAGQSWFEPAEMKFFGTKVHDTVYPGGHFVTSEQPPSGPRSFSVRKAHADGSISTVGEFGGHPTRHSAHAAARHASAEWESQQHKQSGYGRV